MRILVCDCETTGFIGSTLIEVAAQTYCTETRTVLASVQFLLPSEAGNPASNINHISAEALRQPAILGLQLAFAEMFSDASIIITHNVDFDRHFIERYFPSLPTKPWICTLKDIPFRQGGSQKLAHLAIDLGVPVNTAHRALGDVETLVGLLAKEPNLEARISRVLVLRDRGQWFKLSIPNKLTIDQKKSAGFVYKNKLWCQKLLPEEVAGNVLGVHIVPCTPNTFFCI